MELIIGIVGATGAVGQTAIELLQDNFENFEVKALKLFASKASVGKKILFRHKNVTVEEANVANLRVCDVVLFASDASVSADLIPLLAKEGVLCIDKSSAFRDDPRVALVVPEANARELSAENLVPFPVVANPNCCATPLAVVLAPLLGKFGLRRVIVSTYQSVSGSGKPGIDALQEETRNFFKSEDLKAQDSAVYPKSIAFNVMPFVAKILPSGHTEEEDKIVAETRKILSLPTLKMSATSVRVPTFVGHAESVTIEFEKHAEILEVRNLLAASPGLVFVDEFKSLDGSCRSVLNERGAQENGAEENEAEENEAEENEAEGNEAEGNEAEENDVAFFPTPRDVHGTNAVYVGRVRNSGVFENGVSLWLAADNLRKGAALNAIQIIDTCAANGTLQIIKAKRKHG